MDESQYRVPDAAAGLLAMLPAYPGSLLFVAGLNLALARHFPPDVQRALTGKKLRIRCLDARLAFDFRWRTNGFAADGAGGTPDLSIGATARDFLLLAQRQEDPDTLFFSRRLIMEGDTDLGLLVKNTLDAIDLSSFNPARMLPDAFARMRGRQGS
jgi:O2-independent ubiquinone biosynthesis accessory factor UbiT